MRLVAISLLLLAFGTSAFAHRLDEYLQATKISLEKDRIQAQIRMTPGVAVFSSVMATIDTNGDGVVSEGEQRAYAERVIGDLSLTVDGDRLSLQLISAIFPKTDEMKEGLGDIQIEFSAEARRGGPERKLVFENHHQKPIAAYLVNCLAPRDPDIQVAAQSRNYEQSVYQLDYVQGGVRSDLLALAWWSDGRGGLGAGAVFLIARLALLLRKHRAHGKITSA